MRNLIFIALLFLSFQAFGQAGYFRPKYIGHPTDSNALLVLAWVPDSSKTMWIEFDGTGNDSITFLTDSVCIIDMGDEICVSIDSVYFTDSTICYIQLPDTNCVAWTANAVNIYNSNGALNGNRIVDFNGNFLQFRNGSTQPSFLLAPSSSQRFAEIMFHHSGTDARALLQLANSASGSGAERDAYMRFQSPGPVNLAMGLDHSEGRFVLSDSSNLKNPWLSYSIAGDSLIIPRHLNNSWSGANGGSGQTTRTAYFSNTRTGTSSTNYGLYAVASGGTLNYGIYGNGTNRGVWGTTALNGGYGVYGESTNGTSGFGVLGTAAGSAGVGVFAQTTAGGDALYAISTKSNTNSTARTALFSANSTGTAAAGFGAYMDLQAETSTTNNITAGLIEWKWTDATHASRTSQITLSAVGNTTTNEVMYIDGDKRIRFNGRAQNTQGADVASVAGAIALGYDGNVFEITGTNAITLITSTGWQNGSEITLFFTSTASLVDGTANSGGDVGMELAGNANFSATADDVITLVLCEIGGTQRWREKSRSVN